MKILNRYECPDGCCVRYFMSYGIPRYYYHRKRDGILRINNDTGEARYLTWWESIKYRWRRFWDWDPKDPSSIL